MRMITRTLKDIVDFFWHTISQATFKDVNTFTMNDTVFMFDLRTGRDARIHLAKKHCSPIVRKVVNDMLEDQKYVVDVVKYRFRGMDVFVTKK